MQTIPLTINQANDFVRSHPRHNAAVTGCKFAIGAMKDGTLVGVAVAGRPIARLLDDGTTLEVLRVCTDGTRNANSFLYDKVRKIAALMGYKKVITYTLESESGASLRAIGGLPQKTGIRGGWNRPNRTRRNQSASMLTKIRWEILAQPSH